MPGNRQMNGTREFITVYSGQLTLSFQDREYVLEAGEAAPITLSTITSIRTQEPGW